MTTFEITKHAALLGTPSTLLQWAEGVKGGAMKWGHIQPEAWRTEDWDGKYNVGLKCGYDGGGLFDVEFDSAAAETHWLALNSWALTTHQTKGSRGTHYWIRPVGAPARTQYMYFAGEHAGEYRGAGAQSIIAGIHPETKLPYTHNGLTVLSMNWSDIVWGDITFVAQKEKKPKKAELVAVPNEASDSLVTGMGQLVDDVIRTHIPHALNTNHKILFSLARSLSRLNSVGIPVDMEKAFATWADTSSKYFRPGKVVADYKEEFDEALKVVDLQRDPLANAIISAKAVTKSWPQIADPRKEALLRVCWQLSEQGTKEFYLSSRAAASATGQDFMTASRWLSHFRKLGILEITIPHSPYRAARYQFKNITTTK